jgi:large conductance mechanosensitive channel
MGMLSEFKDFAMRGNVVDMAVGIIIGGAFGKIVTALVDKVMMPPIGYLTGGVDFSKKAINLAVSEGQAPVVIGYGEFVNAVIQFIIIAFCLFMIVKAMNSVKKKAEAAPAAPPAQEVLLTEIRDLLKKQA